MKPGFLKALMVSLLVAVGGMAASAEDDGLAQFREAADVAAFHIRYDDLSFILDATVFEAGMSDRSYAPPPAPGIGRRIYRGNWSPNRLEGNRLYFRAFQNEQNLAALHHIRRELEALPGAVPMREWTKNQQLAYWLNLYNATLIEAIALEYPVTNIRGLLYGDDGLLNRKLLTVGGVKLSLNDIHHKILVPNWQDPLIMYGMFQGYIGSPNIRAEAYTDANVYRMLRENAVEFINSNRGLVRRGDGIRIAEIYDRNRALFPDWPVDLVDHLAAYATDTHLPGIWLSVTINPENEDYYIADLLEGVTHDSNPFEGTRAGLEGSGAPEWVTDTAWATTTTGQSIKFPPMVNNYIAKIRQKRAKQEGNVSVEEVLDGKAEEGAEADDDAETPDR